MSARKRLTLSFSSSRRINLSCNLTYTRVVGARDNQDMRYAIPLVVCALILTVAKDATAQSYTVYPLQPAFGRSSSFDYDGDHFGSHAFIPLPVDMNNAGQIVLGRLFWDRSSAARTLPIPDGPVNKVHINNAGVIAGTRELGPGRSELFTIENGTYIVRPIPLAHPWLYELTDNNRLLIYDRATRSSWIVDAFGMERVGDSAIDINESGVVAEGTSLRFPSGRRVQLWSEPWHLIHEIGASGHAVGGDRRGSTVIYARPDGVTRQYRFDGFHPLAAFFGMWSHMNRAGEALISMQAQGIFFQQSVNFLYRDGPVIDINGVMQVKGWVVCETAAINDQGAIVALAFRTERGYGCEAVLLYPDPPAAPRDFIATLSGRTVTLTWTSGADVRGHVLEVGSSPGASNLLRMPLGEQPSLTTTAPPGRYYVRLRAVNGVAAGVPSAEVIIDVP